MTRTATVTLLAALSFAVILGAAVAPSGRPSGRQAPASLAKAAAPRRPAAVGYPSFESPHVSPIAVSGVHVFVVNTPASTLDVIDPEARKVIARVHVGIDPVCVAARPDGREVWVANHVSDSVSVVDSDPKSPTYLQVVATVQEIDPKTRATRFDEPAGIAFAGNDKAYVALSSENEIAVVDTATRKVTRRLTIPAQDPRAIAVRGGRLYVLPFESNNKTQLSGGTGKIDGDLVTFNAFEHSIRVNNVLSLGHVVDIVKHPRVPDRDLFVFDTRTDKLVSTVDTLGTLLYGLAVDSGGRVFIAQTDARNDVNGRAGTKKHGLKEMENRAFLNRITRVSFQGDAAEKPTFFDLEPLPPKHPDKGQALATPYAIQVSDDGSTLVVTAAGSDKLFTVDAASGQVLGRAVVGAVPRGVALECDSGQLARAWALNAVDNSVSLVDVSDPARPKVTATIPLQDPTHPAVKRGRIAFNSAAASTTGTFSCASCHPDGHTDQLLWVLDTPIVTGGNQIMPRSTMPVRGLRDTAPYHWDGIPGDPYGGIHSASIRKSVPPNSKLDDPSSPTRHLIDGALATTMHTVGDKAVNDEGNPGALSARQRDDMALYLLSVPYPPAQRRAYTNVLSKPAEQGFRLFHIDGDHDPKQPTPNVCGNCHRMPFWVSTNTPGTGMDAPTWRGAYDRWLILPQGRLNIIDFDFYRRVAEQGAPERSVWQFSWGGRRRFDPVWNMVLEGSTGVSGSFARQVTLNKATAKDEQTADLLGALEQSAAEGGVVLEAEGVILDGKKPTPVALQFDHRPRGGAYVPKTGGRKPFARKDLLALASAGRLVATFTARHGARATVDHPQPALWALGPIERQRGRQEFPILYKGHASLTLSGRHFGDDARVIVDGRRVPASVSLKGGEKVVITLSALPPAGMHFLQVQVPEGPFSNDFIFHVAADERAAAELKRELDRPHTDRRQVLADTIAKGDLAEVKKLLTDSSLINARQQGGSTPLSTAALHGRLEIARQLIEKGANVSGANSDGNTPLHAAAFLCRTDMVKLLLEKGASTIAKNKRGETPIDVVSTPWSKELADFYTGLGNAVGLKLDLKRIEQDRPKIAQLLREQGKKAKGEAKPAFKAPDDVAFRKADIMSEGTRMSAEVFAPKKPASDRLPTIVMSHGWGGTAAALRPDAIAFARAGYLVVAFDYRGWGESDARVILAGKRPEPKDGKLVAELKEVRGVVDPIDQTTDILNAINWVVGEKQCDPERIGLWGSSFSGGHVVYVAARDPRVKAFVSQVGSMDARWVIANPQMLKVTYGTGTARARGTAGYPKPGEKFGNLTGVPIFEKLAGYAPIEDIGRCEKCAKLFLIAENEELFDNKDHAILAHKRATGVKKLVTIPKITHYGIYREARGRAQKEAIAWFDEHLKKSPPTSAPSKPGKAATAKQAADELEALAAKLKAAVQGGKMTEKEAIAAYKKRFAELSPEGAANKAMAKKGNADSFYAIVIGRLKSKDVELGELELDVDHVTSIYGDQRLKDTIVGKTVKVVGVAGAWLDKLLLIKKGETLKVRSGTLNGTTLSLSPKATVLEQAAPFDPKVYPIPPKEFRGFQGVVTGKITSKSDQGYELTLRVDKVEETFAKSAAAKPSVIEGRLLDLRGFYDPKFRKTFDGLRVGDTIRLGALHSDTKSDPLDVTRVLEKTGK